MGVTEKVVKGLRQRRRSVNSSSPASDMLDPLFWVAASLGEHTQGSSRGSYLAGNSDSAA